MIEVTAKLPYSHVFLSGDIVECTITFSHPPSPSHKVSQSHTDVFESLAWASAQIHCQCFTDSKLSKDHDRLPQLTFADTSLGASTGENGKIEVATKPKILFCTQRVNSPVRLLRVPIRILPLGEAFLNEAVAFCNETTEELTPTNPFLENITARRNPNFYMITNMWGKVARFCLFKPAYKLGEDIIGTFDFTVATVNCMQVSVSLQCEEETTFNPNNENPKQVRIITFSKHHEVCLGYKYTQLILPIPLHVTPAFNTQLVSLKWRLHFEFVTSTHKGLAPSGMNDCDWQAPSEVPIETMVWSLPIRLYSTTPIHVAQGVQTNTVHRLTIRDATDDGLVG
ncbi:hypothetical protein NQ317_012103 [Molorchus minor]|uniref:RAB6A-GEF complex partner protein 2 n=1 Tax=Molorchus minor TaxID=1323400 RepID=A0ABQ9J7A3_9CUCU|nr:hypothetical protein NQ317_012103 [Molorchus minor]